MIAKLPSWVLLLAAAGLNFGMSDVKAADAPLLSYPVMPVELVHFQEHKDRGVLIFDGATDGAIITLQEMKKAGKGHLAQILKLAPEGDMNPVRLKTEGAWWEAESLMVDENHDLLVITQQAGAERSLVFVRGREPFREVLRIPLGKPPADAAAKAGGDWPFATWPAAVEGKRVHFAEQVPTELAAYFSAGRGLAQSDYWWLERINPEHLHLADEGVDRGVSVALEGAVADLQTLIKTRKATKDDREALLMLQKIIAAGKKPAVLPAPKLMGNWKVRSIQSRRFEEGAFLYPWFKAEIKETNGRALFFAKTTGSQRRSGLLLPTMKGGWVFLGGVAMNDDPQTSYSRRRRSGRNMTAWACCACSVLTTGASSSTRGTTLPGKFTR
ncbi:MAG: DUF4893 domain-containing protein [Prosthecobacter sp.]|nr:DUF4893 domain-containing protein [Prosthecobacter sp.]